MPIRRVMANPLAVALIAFSAYACRDTLTTADLGPGDEVTKDIGVTVRDEVEAALSALTLQTAIAPVGTTQASSTAFTLACVTPSSSTDSDGDGVLDDAVFSFTAPPCRFTGWRGGTLDIVGQLRIQDPLPTAAGFGYDATLTDVLTRFIAAESDVIYDVQRNGTRILSGSTAGLILSANLQVLRDFPGKLDAQVDKQWTVTYTPAAPLQINLPLPSGTLDIAGTINWLRGDETFDLTITTPTPLHYNAGCIDTVQRIDAGELNAAGTFDDIEGFVRVRWTECGREPTYGFVAAE